MVHQSLQFHTYDSTRKYRKLYLITLSLSHTQHQILPTLLFFDISPKSKYETPLYRTGLRNTHTEAKEKLTEISRTLAHNQKELKVCNACFDCFDETKCEIWCDINSKLGTHKPPNNAYGPKQRLRLQTTPTALNNAYDPKQLNNAYDTQRPRKLNSAYDPTPTALNNAYDPTKTKQRLRPPNNAYGPKQGPP